MITAPKLHVLTTSLERLSYRPAGAVAPDLDAVRFAGRSPVAPARRNWRRRVFQPAAEAPGLETIRPYDLRHSFVSLLIAERRTIVDVARQAGHSPSMALNTYGHVSTSSKTPRPRPGKS
jgi:integrase